MVLGSGIRDPGSRKNLFRIPDLGVKKAPDPGSGSATLPDPDPDFLPIPDPGSRGLKGQIRNTGYYFPVPGHWLGGRHTEDDVSAEEEQLLLAFPSFQDIDLVEGIREAMSPLEEE